MRPAGVRSRAVSANCTMHAWLPPAAKLSFAARPRTKLCTLRSCPRIDPLPSSTKHTDTLVLQSLAETGGNGDGGGGGLETRLGGDGDGGGGMVEARPGGDGSGGGGNAADSSAVQKDPSIVVVTAEREEP